MIRRAYSALGLLGWIGVLTLVAGALIQHFSTHLPGSYTWLSPFDTLRLLYGQTWFPTAVFVTFVIAELHRRSNDVLGVPEPSPQRRTLLLVAAAVTLLDVVFFPAHNAADAGGLLCLGVAASGAPLGRDRWLKLVGHIVVGAAVFAFICYFYSVVKALTLVGRTQNDELLAGFERDIFGFFPHQAVAGWASTRPALVRFCDWVYFHFFQHMALTTVLLTTLRQRSERFEYLGALGFCYVIGCLLYHVLPAIGPGYFDPETYKFLADNPSLLTNPIRSGLFHHTKAVLDGTEDAVMTWGYIACMPSLHIAHELVMLYYARRARVAFAVAAAFTSATLLAVVVLGWHYFVDAIGGLAVAATAIAIARWQRASLMPARLAPEPDEPLVARPFREWLAAVGKRLPAAPALDEARAKKAIAIVALGGLAARLVIGFRDLDETDRLFVTDDAYTMLSLARSLAHGLGATVNGVALAHPFAPVGVFLAVPAFWVSSSPTVPLIWVLLLAIVADAASIWLLGSIGRRIGSPAMGLVAAVLWALSPLAIANALDGLETAIAFALQLALVEAVLRDTRRAYLVAGVCAGLALLARVDSVFLLLALALVARRKLLPVAGIAAAIAAPWAIYSLSRFHAVIPENVLTAHASLRVHALTDAPLFSQIAWMGGTLLGGSVTDLAAVRNVLFDAPIAGAAVLAVVVGALALAVRRCRAPIFYVLAAHALVVTVLAVPALWLAPHFLAPAYGVASLAFAYAVTSPRRDSAPWRRFGAALATVVAAGFLLTATGHFLRGLPDSFSYGRGLNAPFGFETAAKETLANLPDGAVIGTFQSGALGYFAPPSVRVVDLDGAVDERARTAGETQMLLDYAFEQRLTFMADWRFNIESLRILSAKAPRPFSARPLGPGVSQGGQRFTLYEVAWPSEPGEVRPRERP